MILQDGVMLGQCVGSSLGLMKMFRQNWTLFTATLPGYELLKVEKIAIRFQCGDSGHYPITVPSPINSLCNTRCKRGLERRGCEHVAAVHFPVDVVACGLGVCLFLRSDSDTRRELSLFSPCLSSVSAVSQHCFPPSAM